MSENNLVKKYILWGIPIIIILGFPMHFAYEFSGENTLVGILAPVNESVWEHLKLCFYPLIIYWTLGYFLLKNKVTINVFHWFTCCLICLLTYILCQLGIYYLYTGATGCHSLIMDILCMVFAVTFAQWFALHMYAHTKSNAMSFYISIFLIAALIFYFTICTFNPPRLPMFKDSTDNTYGISKLK
ncbi:hypothetical protein SAMN02745248_00257 [Hathewaya proteolytica DSM 3090]|uniref:Uncharacterized protein n=1 Tax=Hathewaya proteolytica DSM 3090 TaxID=1121331 RepID=A0A1M6JNP1_9CLOT|nr:DUF6512 family protein [Hathewaya proteolytica]SHJ48258.1 hypothetical protein SAMN02745248_00257 [Hathewaya proteolytica DSM 3090]